MTEEDVKARIVLPWLERLGFSPLELKLEESFTIHVGRHVFVHKPKQSRIGARLDILVQRNGRNLFVVETKEADQSLTEADRDQAVSYARLVTPVAAFAVVTNGTDWKIYDTLSKLEVTGTSISSKSNFEIALPPELTEEATEVFLGLSSQNLKQFCDAQLKSALVPIEGSPSDLTKKYVPELHVPDAKLTEWFSEFLQSATSAAVVLGDSGLGKTCELCDLAKRAAAEGVPVLFYQGLLLEAGLASQIAQDFNWTFAEQQREIPLFRKLKQIVKQGRLVVFVDALDEWTYSQKVQNIVAMLEHLPAIGVKIFMSCKSGAWDVFCQRGGTRTGIERFLFPGPKVETSKQSSIFSLGGFDDLRFGEALSKYFPAVHAAITSSDQSDIGSFRNKRSSAICTLHSAICLSDGPWPRSFAVFAVFAFNQKKDVFRSPKKAKNVGHPQNQHLKRVEPPVAHPLHTRCTPVAHPLDRRWRRVGRALNTRLTPVCQPAGPVRHPSSDVGSSKQPFCGGRGGCPSPDRN